MPVASSSPAKQNIIVSESGDSPPQWLAQDDRPLSFGRHFVWPALLFALPGLVALFIGGLSDDIRQPIVFGFLVLGLSLGTVGYRKKSRDIVALRIETQPAGPTLVLTSRTGQVHSVSLTAIDNVHVTLNKSPWPPVVGIAVSFGGARHRAQGGPEADALISALEAAGVNITTSEVRDDPD